MRDLAGEIEWAKASLISPEDYPNAVAESSRDIPLDAQKVSAVYSAYEKLTGRPRRGHTLDFDDLLLHRGRDRERPVVAAEFRDRYRCFPDVVDPGTRDVTPLQAAGARRLARRAATTLIPSSATPADHLLLHRRLAALSARLLATVPRRDRRSTARLPLHPQGGVALANRVIAAAGGRIAGSSCT